MKETLYNDVLAMLRVYNNAIEVVKNHEEWEKIVESGKHYMKDKTIELSNYAKRKYCIFLT